MNAKQRALSVLRCEKADRIPVFPLLMGFASRQAGLNYREYASDGSLLAKAQIAVAERFDIDAVSACSDAFRIAAGLGGEIIYHDETPPHIRRPVVTSRRDLDGLSRFDVSDKGSRCADRAKAVREMAGALGQSHLVLGWVDLPFAEACSCCGCQEFMFLMIDDPGLAHDILAFLTDIDVDFALYQMEQGAPMIGCGDAAASLVSAEMFEEFALPYEQRVVKAIHDKGGLAKTHICGNTSAIMAHVVKNGSDLFNVDHMVNLSDAIRVYCEAGKAVKGNVNPVEILQSTPEETFALARRCIGLAGDSPYFLSAGCEIPTDTADENLAAFCAAARV